MSNDEKKFQPIFQILHIKNAWFLLELATALVTTIGMRFLQVCNPIFCFFVFGHFWSLLAITQIRKYYIIFVNILQGKMGKTGKKN